jgi:hypothetical protein
MHHLYMYITKIKKKFILHLRTKKKKKSNIFNL